MYIQKKQVRLSILSKLQPNRVFSKDDLGFIRRAAEIAPSEGWYEEML